MTNKPDISPYRYFEDMEEGVEYLTKHEALYFSSTPEKIGTSETEKTVFEAASSNTDQCIIWGYASYSANYYTAAKMFKSLNGKGLGLNPCRISLILAKGPPPSEDRNQCAHDPLNCKSSLCINPNHLRWATRQENQDDMEISGTVVKGERNGRSKLTESDVIKILQDPRHYKYVAKDFPVSAQSVYLIKKRKRWSHVALHSTP